MTKKFDAISRWQIVQVAEQLQGHGVKLAPETQAQLIWIKTALQYEFSLRDAIRDLYRAGPAGTFAYVDRHASLIREQFGRAWREGMREVGVDPENITFEEQFELEQEIDREDDFVINFASEIINASLAGQPVQPFLNRAAVWANRYNDIKNKAKMMAGKDQNLEWVLGPTEHCATCQKLAGFVKRGSVWQTADIRPQNPPNDKLECGGWNCQCELTPTTKRGTRGKLPKVP